MMILYCNLSIIWNKLLNEIKLYKNLNTFKRRTFLLSNVFLMFVYNVLLYVSYYTDKHLA